VGSVAKDGQTWRLGTNAEVAWIDDGTSIGRTISAAIPEVFAAYATLALPDDRDRQERHDQAVLAVLTENSADQHWWLGYLDTGADDVVFPDAPMVTLYPGWQYVLVEAGPEQAATWRWPGLDEIRPFGKGVLPDLIFPADRSWLLSTMWDDDWSCVGGSASLVADLLRHPDLQARQVLPGDDATPPGHTAFRAPTLGQ
jgi:hypothetical protein